MSVCFCAYSQMRCPVRLTAHPGSLEIQACFSDTTMHAEIRLKILAALHGIADLHARLNADSIPTSPFFLAKQGPEIAPLKNPPADLMHYLYTASKCRAALPIFFHITSQEPPPVLQLHSFSITSTLNNGNFVSFPLRELLLESSGPAFTEEWYIQNALFEDCYTGISCQVNTPIIAEDSNAAVAAMKVASFIKEQNGSSSPQPFFFGDIDFGFSPLLAKSIAPTPQDPSEPHVEDFFYLIDRSHHYNMFPDIAIIANDIAAELADLLIQVRVDEYSEATKKLHEGTYSDKLQIDSKHLSMSLGKWIIPHYIHKYHQCFHELPSASKVACYMSFDSFWQTIGVHALSTDAIIHTLEHKKEFPELIPPSYMYSSESSPSELYFKTRGCPPVQVHR